MTKSILDTSLANFDDHEKNFISKIQEHGFFRTEIMQEENFPNYSFSTGMWLTSSLPELNIFSYKSEFCHNLFWNIFKESSSGLKLENGQRTDQIFENGDAYVFHVAKKYYEEYFGWSNWFYQGFDYPCLQIVWSDKNNVFPWEPEFDEAFIGLQTDLTENGWKASIVD